MRRLLVTLDIILMKIMKFASYIAGICIALAAASICFEVFSRSIFNAPTEWTLEVTGYLVLIGGLLGFAPALAADKHITVDLLTSHLSGKTNRILNIITMFIGLLFSVVLLVYGWDMVEASYRLGRTSTSTLHVPLFIPQTAVPTAGLLLIMQFLRKIIISINSLTKKSGDQRQEV